MSLEILTTGLLRAVGVFYTLGGGLVLWGTLTAALAERATAAIEMKPVPTAQVWRARWLVASALLLLTCGLALALLLTWTVPLFLASAAGQALYLTVLAPRYFDPVEAPDGDGRRGSRNALAVFAIVTALVMAAASAGWLQDWRAIPGSLLAGAVGLVLFATAYAVINLRPLK